MIVENLDVWVWVSKGLACVIGICSVLLTYDWIFKD